MQVVRLYDLTCEDRALPGFKHWHKSKDALPQAITHEGFLSDGEHW